ncbi:MAG: DUF4258 domain-containing protein [Rhizobiaceae bacterium]
MASNKPIRYTRHAETVLEERKINRDWVETTLFTPDWDSIDPAAPEITRRYRPVPERDGRILRVVFVETPDEIRILSAYFDRGARKPHAG